MRKREDSRLLSITRAWASARPGARPGKSEAMVWGTASLGGPVTGEWGWPGRSVKGTMG